MSSTAAASCAASCRCSSPIVSRPCARRPVPRAPPPRTAWGHASTNPRSRPPGRAPRTPRAAPGPPSAAEPLQGPNIHARTQAAARTGLPSATVDLFVSTGVLEYIPVPAIEQILAEFRRVGSPDAVQSHYLNLADEYSYFDPSITPFNFLRFSERRWKYLNSPLAWLNRLRVPDYRRLFDRAGFEIIKEFNTSGRLEDLKKIQLAPEFRSYREEDLLVLASWLTVQPQGRRPNGS